VHDTPVCWFRFHRLYEALGEAFVFIDDKVFCSILLEVLLHCVIYFLLYSKSHRHGAARPLKGVLIEEGAIAIEEWLLLLAFEMTVALQRAYATHTQVPEPAAS